MKLGPAQSLATSLLTAVLEQSYNISWDNAHPEFDKLLPLNVGGDQHLVNHTTLALAQTAADIALGEALCLPRGLIWQRGCLADDHILTWSPNAQLNHLINHIVGPCDP